MAAREAGRVLEDQEPHLSDPGTWPAWQDWRDAVVRRYERQGVNCPLGVLITELGRATPAARALAGQLTSQWRSALRAGVQRLQDTGEVGRRLDADRTAAALVAAVRGGVSLPMSTGSTARLEAALDTTLTPLRTTASSAPPVMFSAVLQGDRWPPGPA